MMKLTCFKAYDIRGKLGTELNESIAYNIGRAYGQLLQPKKIVVGADIRPTSHTLKMAIAQGLMDSGVDVIDIGMTGTEEVYFASFHLDVDGGIEVTASHNPMDYNGMKLVKKNAQPISGDTGLLDIKALAETEAFTPITHKGTLTEVSILEDYVTHLLTYLDIPNIKPLKIVVNAGNGAAGHVIDALESRFAILNIPISFIKIHHEADGSFPNGIPNPILLENRAATIEAVKTHHADFGVAWDGDFDRCFLFDEHGVFIEGYYIVGLLAQAFLLKNPGEKIIHDPRLTWNTIDIAQQSGGEAIQCKTGHAFIKERMRKENAIYGGEMSAHHYFRDFAYCDSGMIPWLLAVNLVSNTGKGLSTLVKERMAAYPCSGEINFRVDNSAAIIDKILQHYSTGNPELDKTDGLSLSFADWRFNLRTSNTEPLLRLNVEARGPDAQAIMTARTAELQALIGAEPQNSY
ncbi:phosphohexomutase domain-containing protein [Aquirhabdus parva]|uniref:phosphomannomutase n=1 Tax=Aquirhabdus parva TaxID=2283318 RepID=A0A345PAF0_9GAMM|nr:phosphomannomutase CpsG [Aquirhabdus parva]AXI04259.1 phosphomannomutase CpsG [Aquirhabdus parva]